VFTYRYLQLYRVKKNTGCTGDDCVWLAADKPMTRSMHSDSDIPLHSGNIYKQFLWCKIKSRGKPTRSAYNDCCSFLNLRGSWLIVHGSFSRARRKLGILFFTLRGVRCTIVPSLSGTNGCNAGTSEAGLRTCKTTLCVMLGSVHCARTKLSMTLCD